MFTCLYVHNPDLIEEPALKAFALGILKVCDIAREKVNKAAVFEEVSNFPSSFCQCIFVCLFLVLCLCLNDDLSHICLQEDFQAMTYGFKMANNVTDLRVTGTAL